VQVLWTAWNVNCCSVAPQPKVLFSMSQRLTRWYRKVPRISQNKSEKGATIILTSHYMVYPQTSRDYYSSASGTYDALHTKYSDSKHLSLQRRIQKVNSPNLEQK
jgi:hypothetical protein